MGNVTTTIDCPVCGAQRRFDNYGRLRATCGRPECISERIKGRERVYVIRSLDERFWEKVDKRGPDDCWDWQGGKAHGYGRIGIAGREIDGAHRVSWQLHYGPIPAGMHVLHRCDNPPCVNPRHLFLGDQVANNLDREAKGRGTIPPNHHRGKHKHGCPMTGGCDCYGEPWNKGQGKGTT